jgi:tRNA pseudouridine55 synthase
LYDLARRGETTEIASRKVNIYTFEITEVNLPYISFRIACSKGTYIRSIADDFGRALNSGAYLSALRRTKIGDYSVENAISPAKFQENLTGIIVENQT